RGLAVDTGPPVESFKPVGSVSACFTGELERWTVPSVQSPNNASETPLFAPVPGRGFPLLGAKRPRAVALAFLNHLGCCCRSRQGCRSPAKQRLRQSLRERRSGGR